MRCLFVAGFPRQPKGILAAFHPTAIEISLRTPAHPQPQTFVPLAGADNLMNPSHLEQ
jgi:hypothetical protein